MPYKSKDEYNQYLREYMRRKRSVKPVKPDVKPVPLYNPSVHRAGDVVRVIRGKKEIIVKIPLIDAEGNLIPDY